MDQLEAPFSRGDKVKVSQALSKHATWHQLVADRVYQIASIYEDDYCQSGWKATVEGVDRHFDAAWFERVT